MIYAVPDIALVLALAGASPVLTKPAAATSSPSATERAPLGKVEYVIGERDDYPINIADEDIIGMQFDLPCTVVPEHEMAGFRLVFDGGMGFLRRVGDRPKGYVATLTVKCNDGLALPLRVRITDREHTTTSVHFIFSGKMKDTLGALKAGARSEANTECQKQRTKDALSCTADFQQRVLKSLETDVTRDEDPTASSEDGKLIVYVDRVRRWGENGLIDFRVENLSKEIVHLGEIEIRAKGNEFAQALIVAHDKAQLQAEQSLPPSADAADEVVKGTAPLGYRFKGDKTSLTAAESLSGRVMFPFPWSRHEAGSVGLVIRTTDDKQVVIETINFPRGTENDS